MPTDPSPGDPEDCLTVDGDTRSVPTSPLPLPLTKGKGAENGCRQVVLVDMDGPLADFDRLFFERCGTEGWPMNCEFAEQSARYATDHVVDRSHRKQARAMVDAAGWFADLPVTPGAAEGLHALAEHADVWVCTKPLEANPTCRDDKGRWIAKHFGSEWERRLIITPDKSLIAGAVLLDDAPLPEWFERATWNPVMYPTSWNGVGSVWEGLPRWGWGDPVDLLLSHATSGLRGSTR